MVESTPSSFLWIHKDQSSQNLKAVGDEGRKVQRYVQRVSRQRRLQENANDEGSSVGPKPSSSHTFAVKARTSSSKASKALKASKDVQDVRWVAILPKGREEEDDERHEETRADVTSLSTTGAIAESQQQSITSGSANLREVESNWSIPKNNFIAGSAVDSFACTPVPLRHEHDSMISYYRMAQMLGGNPYKLSFLPKSLQGIARPEVVRDTTTKNALLYKHNFYALMGFMSIRMIKISHMASDYNGRPEYYMHQAIIALRERLLELQEAGLPADNATIGCINQIALATWTSGDLEATRIHLQVLVQLLQTLDVTQYRGLFLFESICTLDVQTAVELGTIPLIAAEPDRFSLPSQRMDQIRSVLKRLAASEHDRSGSHDEDIQETFQEKTNPRRVPQPQQDILVDASVTLDFCLGSGFVAAINQGIIDPEFEPILQDVLDCLDVAKFVWRTSYATESDARWMCCKSRLTVYRQLIYLHRDSGQASLLSRKSDCLCLAIFIMMTHVTNRMAFRAASVIAKRLQGSLASIHQDWVKSLSSADILETEILFWIFTTGAFALRDKPEESWFLEYAALIATEKLGLNSYEGLHGIMGRYLYSFTMQEVTLQKLVSIIDSR